MKLCYLGLPPWSDYAHADVCMLAMNNAEINRVSKQKNMYEMVADAKIYRCPSIHPLPDPFKLDRQTLQV